MGTVRPSGDIASGAVRGSVTRAMYLQRGAPSAPEKSRKIVGERSAEDPAGNASVVSP